MKKYILSFISLLSFPKHLVFLICVYFKYFIGIKTKPLIGVNWNAFSLEKTFIRWGDGETMLALGIPMVFFYQYENSSREISCKIKNILSYTGDEVVIGLPKKYLINNEDNTPDIRAWIITRAFFQSGYNLRKEYDDAFFYRHLGTFEKFLGLYAGKNIFLITNQDSINKILSDGRLSIIGSFPIPSRYAFQEYSVLKPQIIDILSEFKDKKNLIILISGGPAGKILAFDLTVEHGYVCHDAGQFFDLYLN